MIELELITANDANVLVYDAASAPLPPIYAKVYCPIAVTDDEVVAQSQDNTKVPDLVLNSDMDINA